MGYRGGVGGGLRRQQRNPPLRPSVACEVGGESSSRSILWVVVLESSITLSRGTYVCPTTTHKKRQTHLRHISSGGRL
jgi:hypothetical protein